MSVIVDGGNIELDVIMVKVDYRVNVVESVCEVLLSFKFLTVEGGYIIGKEDIYFLDIINVIGLFN